MPPALDIVITGIYGTAPVQAEGTVNGHPFFFRSRGSRWSLEVSPSPDRHFDASAWRYVENYAPWPDAGYMPEQEVRGKIIQALTRWFEQTRPIAIQNIAIS